MGNCLSGGDSDPRRAPSHAPPKAGLSPADRSGPSEASKSSRRGGSGAAGDHKVHHNQSRGVEDGDAARAQQQEAAEARRHAEGAALMQQSVMMQQQEQLLQQRQQELLLQQQQIQQQQQQLQQQEQMLLHHQQQQQLQQQRQHQQQQQKQQQQAQEQQYYNPRQHPGLSGGGLDAGPHPPAVSPVPGMAALQQVHEMQEDAEADESMWEVNVHDSANVPPPELQEYSYQDLVLATDNFQDSSVLGEGGFGKVYKGYVLDRHPVGGGAPREATVAIKKLNPSGYQSKVEWMREILVLGKLQHPNLVRLIGYCAEVEEMLLIYEFVPRGSLDYHLWPGIRDDNLWQGIATSAPNSAAPPLTWQARLRIAHDAAAGLAHLHASNFIHRDFKAPNILIDEDFSGKLTDFGLAKDGPDPGQTHVSTQIMGTMGYLDPRYAETGQLTVKSDVYAYGVVLLELLTGKKAMGISPGGKPKTLTSWARPLLTKGRPDLESLVDPNLLDPFPEKVARTLAISAKHCIQDDTSMRPMMSDIVDTLRPLNMAINGRR